MSITNITAITQLHLSVVWSRGGRRLGARGTPPKINGRRLQTEGTASQPTDTGHLGEDGEGEGKDGACVQ